MFEIDTITKGVLSAPSDLIDLEETLVPNGFAFRGQSQAYGTLHPSFQRVFTNKKSHGTADIIENDLITTFREHYQKLDNSTLDMPKSDVIATGYHLQCLTVMQHYGVPTRLLDWTTHLWTAIYFACAGDPDKDAELWIYDLNIFNSQPYPELRRPVSYQSGKVRPLDPQLLGNRTQGVILEYNPRITPRMHNQHAHHTFTLNIFDDHAPLLDSLSNLSAIENGVRRYIISSNCKEKALRFVREQKDITASSIFPDVEGLNKFLHWHLESLVTTLL